MKVVFGVEREADPAATLLQRLKLPEAQVDVVHVLAPSDYLTYGIDVGLTSDEVQQVVARQDRDARSIVAAAEKKIETAYDCETFVLFGAPTRDLLSHTDRADADLLVLNAAHTHSETVAALTGSVVHGAVTGAHQSVLVARGAATLLSESRPLRALFATDHSDYGLRCWEKFLDMAPAGISHIGIVSAYPKERLEAMQELLPGTGLSLDDAVRDELLRRNERLITRTRERLFAHELAFESFATPEPVMEAIARAMDAMSADLLILGAKGHGFLERITMGSVSLRQAIAGMYSTLILRA
jgi:nucleotide-binding universal stress UspA family protein